jgi:hypothetical protein
MSSASNVYAEKVFAEQPIALWALDDPIDYISFISEEQRDLNLWSISGGMISVPASTPNPPFLESTTSYIVGEPSTQFNEVSAVSPLITSTALLDQSLETFTIGSYIYSDHPYVTGYEIGYEYEDPNTGIDRQVLRFFNSQINNQWLFISETFRIPTFVSDLKIVIKARYSIDPQEILPGYGFYINGVSFGQWSEEFNAGSLGVDQSLVTPLSDIITDFSGIRSFAYAKEEDPAYYAADLNKLYAKNTSIPMVFGSANTTKIIENPGKPSVIVSGKGLLNESGRYQEYTLETWIRLQHSGTDLRRIIGPINSQDGVYVNGPFVTLVIGSSFRSHFVGEWFRPMLLTLKVGINYASLLINGQDVIVIEFDTEDIPLPSSADDWIGFYAYEDVQSVELDVVGIYPYLVPSILSKRRFAFGQAVESPEGVNRAYGGKVALIDYKFADYTNNYSYPDIGKWNQGIAENINTSRGFLSPPPYSDPQVILRSQSFDDFIDEQDIAPNGQNSFIRFSQDGCLFLNNFSLSFQKIRALYGIFEIDEYSEDEKTLIQINNPATNSSFKVSLQSEYILYRFMFWGEQRTLYFRSGVSEQTPFFAGIDVENISNFFGDDIRSFFGSNNQLEIYVANDSSLSSQFDGKIHRFGISTARNFSKISQYFDNLEIDAVDLIANPGDIYFGNYDPNNPYSTEFFQFFLDGGFVTTFDVTPAFSHIASYTVVAKSNFGKTYLDIEVDSYWEDYTPLSYFAQYVDDILGKKYYDLDFLQFNVDYPAIQKFTGNFYDTSSEILRTYISFQYLSTGANKPFLSFANTQLMSKNGVVVPGDNWLSTKYEVVDGAIIYPPSGVNMEDLAIVTHLELAVDGIKTHPMSIKKLEYASQAFNEITSNPVGTKFGIQMYPYSQFAAFIDYKARNPFKIYKGSTPHLYLTRDSGIGRVGDYEPLTPQGIAIPININSAPEYRVIAMQMFMLYNKDSFSTNAVQLFEVQGTEKQIKFYVRANDRTGKRGRITAINTRTGKTEDGVSFYINGKLVRDPVISLDEWVSLGISFATTMKFDEYPGAIRLNDSIIFNNISHYESSNLQEVERQSKRSWSRLFAENDSWLQVLRSGIAGNFLWNDVLVISSLSFFGISPKDIYNAYVGINKIIAEGAQPLLVGKTEYRIFNDIDWNSTVAFPV